MKLHDFDCTTCIQNKQKQYHTISHNALIISKERFLRIHTCYAPEVAIGPKIDPKSDRKYLMLTRERRNPDWKMGLGQLNLLARVWSFSGRGRDRCWCWCWTQVRVGIRVPVTTSVTYCTWPILQYSVNRCGLKNMLMCSQYLHIACVKCALLKWHLHSVCKIHLLCLEFIPILMVSTWIKCINASNCYWNLHHSEFKITHALLWRKLKILCILSNNNLLRYIERWLRQKSLNCVFMSLKSIFNVNIDKFYIEINLLRVHCSIEVSFN